MKPFWGIDLTEDRKNEKADGFGFLVAEPSPALVRELEALEDRATALNEQIEQAELPLPLRLVQWLCGVLAVAGILVLLKIMVNREEQFSVAEVYQAAPWIFWMTGVGLVIWLILKYLSHRREKEALDGEEIDDLGAKGEAITNRIYDDLGVPDWAQTVDLLSFTYKQKNGMQKPVERIADFTPYQCVAVRFFYDQENLYIASQEGKFAFPRSALRRISTVKKNVGVMGWNKEEDFDAARYKPYKLYMDNLGLTRIRTYHILELEVAGEQWGIYFPNYELPVMEVATGLRAE
jgi:hypothetical protein